MYYVYILKSFKDDNLYTGYSSDLRKRLQKHNGGLVAATKHRRPFKRIYYEACVDRKDALSREFYLKSAWGKRYIKNRLSEFFRKSQ